MAKKVDEHFRTGFRFVKSDMDALKKLQRQLSGERGGPVTLSEVVRDAIRYRLTARIADKA